MKAVEINGLSYAYPDGTKALDSVNIYMETGEKIAIIGANGAGKSTLLLHLNGIIPSPSVNIFGMKVVKENIREIRKKVGLVFQNPDDQLFCPTVYEDVAFGPRNMGVKSRDIAGLVEASIKMVGLKGLAKKAPFHLSTGQKKRAALAAVLAMNPEILVMDEPTSNLDPCGRREIITLLKEIDVTRVIATHDFGMVKALCDRAIVMHKGRIVQDGEPAKILMDEVFLMAIGLA